MHTLSIGIKLPDYLAFNPAVNPDLSGGGGGDQFNPRHSANEHNGGGADQQPPLHCVVRGEGRATVPFSPPRQVISKPNLSLDPDSLIYRHF